MTVILERAIKRFTGISTDTKPTSVPAGSYFWEYDTNDVYKTYDGTNWLVQTAKSVTHGSAETMLFNQAVSDYPLYTATAGAVTVTSFTLTNTNDRSADAGGFTGMSVIADNTAATELVTVVNGAVANLTAGAVFTYTIAFTLLVGDIINYHVYGAASAAAAPFVVSVTYHPLNPAGYLA